MTNDTALAAVTLALRQRIEAAIEATDGLPADVVSERPEKLETKGAATVNVYLYQGQLNPYLRNADLVPEVVTDTTSGTSDLVRHWVTPLVLNYLVSFYGDEALLIPQRLMAVTVAVLHRHPVFSPKTLAATAAAMEPKAPSPPETDFEEVMLSMLPASLDEVHKLWSALRAPYALSVAYEARTALVQAEPVETPVELVAKKGLEIGGTAMPPGEKAKL